MHTFKRSAALALAAIVSIAGCSGEDGKDGTAGTDGVDLVAQAKPESCEVCHGGSGAIHQSIYNSYTDTSVLTATIDSVVSVAKGTTPETYDVTVTFSLDKNGVPYDVGTTGIKAFGQKTVYVTQYDPVAGTFGPSTSLATLASLGGGQYTAKNNLTATPPVVAAFAPESSDAIVYAYFAENPTLIPVKGNYKLYDNVASAATTFGTVDYVSTANLSACQNCHGTPYMKHGYRAGAVAPLADLVACKTCHYDNRSGHDAAWQLLAEDPAAYAAQAGTPTTAQEAKYAYKATVMNDTHMSHAMEFAYPQTMANCATCHAGKLASVLTQANFTITTCKSCHPVTIADPANADAKRAPALADIMPLSSGAHMGITVPAGLYSDAATTPTCNTTGCHVDTSATLKFAAIHTGYNKQIYADAAGTRYAMAASVTSASFAAATNTLTVAFSMSGVGASDIVKPTLVVSLYGYDSKDFVVSGHGSQSDGTNNLEYTYGAMQRSDPTKSANSARLTLSPAAPTAGTSTWTATANLSLWASKIADGSVKRVEVGFLPAVGLDPTVVVSSSTNPGVAVAGVTRTFDLVANALVADVDSYGKAIVDTAKCNKCHDALGTTFHSPSYGSAGVPACRLCHTVLSGGSHLEMQSRSIDSYVHAIHSMQPFDIGDVDFTNAVEKLRYEHHVESTYPNFTLLNCESCHNAGTYEVPDQTLSLPSVLSGADVVADRTIGAIPYYVTGPASRACGSCHRAEMINEDRASDLAAFNSHTEAFGYMLETTSSGATSVLDAAILKIREFFQ